MSEYKCDVCEKVFQQKSHLTSHKKRKRPCKKEKQEDAVDRITLLEQRIAVLEKKIKELEGKTTETPVTEVEEQKEIPEPKKNTKQVIKPFLKWVGGKTQILDKVLELFPEEINNYYEPFLGGGSVLLGLLSSGIQIKGKVYASDLNKNLIWLYKNIQQKPDELIKEVKKILTEFGKCKQEDVNRKAKTLEEALSNPESYYFWIRSKFNSLAEKESIEASAMVLFMNKTCFRGVYREGPNGFNVPYGNYKNPSVLDEEHIREVSELVKDVIFSELPFTQALKSVKKGDFVYLDPPYAPESEKSFVSYTADGFDKEAHQSLFKFCQEFQKKKIKFLMSNADVELVRKAFPEPAFNTRTIECKRAINSKKPESKTNEVLITA
jgi:DNA adenine methylase